MSGYRRSSLSGSSGGNCVEVHVDNKDLSVRDSKNPSRVLKFPRMALKGFVAAASALTFFGIYALGIAPVGADSAPVSTAGCASVLC